MKNIIKIFMIMGLLSLFGCSKKSILTDEEKNLLKKINFDIELMSEVKETITSFSPNAEIRQLPEINEYGEIVDSLYNGIKFTKINEKEQSLSISSLNSSTTLGKKLEKKGYIAFCAEVALFDGVVYSEHEFNNISIIKGNDKFDALRYRKTNGVNYDILTKDIIAKLKDWDAKYGIFIIGCSMDWVHVELQKLPEDMLGFAKEVYEFCPDTVEQGCDTIEKLKETIEESHTVYMWWD